MTIERKNFSEIFKENSDGSLTPLVVVSLNEVIFGPGVVINQGVLIGGFDIFSLKNKDLAVEKDESNVFVIKGYY